MFRFPSSALSSVHFSSAGRLTKMVCQSVRLHLNHVSQFLTVGQRIAGHSVFWVASPCISHDGSYFGQRSRLFFRVCILLEPKNERRKVRFLTTILHTFSLSYLILISGTSGGLVVFASTCWQIDNRSSRVKFTCKSAMLDGGSRSTRFSNGTPNSNDGLRYTSSNIASACLMLSKNSTIISACVYSSW